MAMDAARVVIVVAIAATLMAPFISVVNDNTGTQTLVNDTTTADAGTYVDLEGYDLVDGTVTVESTTGTAYSVGSDYEVNQSDGTIKVLSSGTISDGATLNVTYDYQATSGSTTTIAGLLPLFMALLILVALAAKVMAMMP